MSLSPISFVAVNYRDYPTYWFKAYQPGTTTPLALSLDAVGSTYVSKLQLNADGFLNTTGGALVTPYINEAYDAWLFPTEAEADANDTSNAIRVADDITGINVESALINDISQEYIFDTMAAYKASTIVFPVGKVINLLDRGAEFTVIVGTSTANNKNIIDNALISQSIVEVDKQIKQQIRETYPVVSTITTIKLFVANVSLTSFRVYFKQEGVDTFLLLNEGANFTVNNVTNEVTFITSFSGAGTLFFYDKQDDRPTAISSQSTFMGNVDVGIQNLHSQVFDTRPFIIAHRCYQSNLPQNTILAASMALLDKFNMLEVDVQPSADGTFYLFHDLTVDTLTNGTGTFNTLTDAYIDTLRFDSLSGTPYVDEPIPTLASYLEFIKENHLQSAIELKKKDTTDVAGFVNQIISAGCEDLVLMQSAYITDCVIVRGITKRLRVSIFTTSKTDALLKVEQLSYMLPSEIWIDQTLTVDRDILDKCNNYGVSCGVFTINSKRQAQAALKNGYNKIVTNVFLGDWS